ncbi:ABC-type transport system permease protein (probable substrate branched-chain amino acids) [Natronomonas moolapensis 8.8.11]|uniref:ABC-type transport system permease protein (Probable substrate branched-chain amino acids) n=1 Tax=Natronomonas moolapensis (strain DSM 18674 / CECT 7526 / JCM 14361 / 8.8.11) TaxID=268739 RepID=M1Y5F6_NATM8|nr:branched-chain amino acid ABC transporter permease [Natronomonas moolapensis]CCQ37798.1 ABC-type transport system permease protein (probable substrate branched-chain amino acids) [Natronomonas moolapensis 8.8.11]
MSVVGSVVGFAIQTLAVSSIYILVAIGLSITLGTLKFVNFAHAAMYLAGVYIGLAIALELQFTGDLARSIGLGNFGLDLGFLAALAVIPIVTFGLGLLMERFVARPFYDRPDTDQILVTFGILLIVQELIRAFVGGRSITFSRPAWAQGAISLGPLGTYASWRLAIIGITSVLVLAVYLYIEYTDVGLAVRAGTEDAEMVNLLGVRATRPFLVIFGVGSGLAGAAGVVGGPVFSVVPEVGVGVLVPAFLVVVVGGVGSIVGSILGGLLIGAVEVGLQMNAPTWSSVGIYALAAVVLLVRPAGLMGVVEVDE